MAGKYAGGEVPEGMMVYEFPGGDWAVFDCIGPFKLVGGINKNRPNTEDMEQAVQFYRGLNK